MARAVSEPLKVQQEPRKEAENTALQMKTVAQLRSTIQSLNTYVYSLSPEVEILCKSRNDAKFTRDVAEGKEALLASRIVSWLSK